MDIDSILPPLTLPIMTSAASTAIEVTVACACIVSAFTLLAVNLSFGELFAAIIQAVVSFVLFGAFALTLMVGALLTAAFVWVLLLCFRRRMRTVARGRAPNRRVPAVSDPSRTKKASLEKAGL